MKAKKLNFSHIRRDFSNHSSSPILAQRSSAYGRSVEPEQQPPLIRPTSSHTQPEGPQAHHSHSFVRPAVRRVKYLGYRSWEGVALNASTPWGCYSIQLYNLFFNASTGEEALANLNDIGAEVLRY